MRGDRGLISQTSCLSRLCKRRTKISGWRAEVGADLRDCRNDGGEVGGAGRSSYMSLGDQYRDAEFSCRHWKESRKIQPRPEA